MEERLEVNLREDYVNRVANMFDYSMIPPGNSNFFYKFILGKARPGEELQTWKNKNWDGYKHCCKVVEMLLHILEFDCQDKFRMNIRIQRVFTRRSLPMV